MADRMVDWGALKTQLANDKQTWTPTGGGKAIDLDALRRQMGYKGEVASPYSVKTQVGYDDGGQPWYEWVFGDAPQWIADKALYTSPLTFLYAAGRDVMDEVKENPQVAKKFAEIMREREKDRGAEVGDAYHVPSGFETLEDIAFGVESGMAGFTELLTGKRPRTFLDAVDELDFRGMLQQKKEGKITKEDYEEYVQQFAEMQQDQPLAREITAGITTSLAILGSLMATGGLSAMSTRGMKLGSKLWWGTKLRGMHKAGLATWKIMAAGSTIGATSDSILEAKKSREEGNPMSFWEFSADLVMNQMRRHSQAYLEGMSEGLLREIQLGSVPMKKWLGVPIKRIIKTATGETKEIAETFGVKQLRRLVKTASPQMQPVYKMALKQALIDRKTIAKELSKNMGKFMANAYGVEISTEQVTDIWSDLVDGTHSSFINLFSSVPEHRQEALKTLYIEAAVSTFLGVGMGMGDIFSRKPLQEIEDQFGPKIAGEIERELNGQNAEELQRKIKKAQKNKTNHNIDAKKEANNAEAILDQGKGKDRRDPNDTDPKEMDGVKSVTPETFIKVTQTVEDQPNANLLDYVLQQGRIELSQYFMNKAQKDPQFRYELDSFLMDASDETVNAISGMMYRDIVQLAAKRGLLDRINWTKKNESALKKDLAVAIALNFDETGWAFLKHKYQTIDNIDYNIAEAQKLQSSNAELEVSPAYKKKMGPQTVFGVQEAARRQYKDSYVQNIGLAVSQTGSIIDAEVGFNDQEELFDEETGELKGSIAGAEVVNEADMEADLEAFGDYLEDGILQETAMTITEMESKAEALANLTKLEYDGYNVYPGDGQANTAIFTFSSPETKQKIKVSQEELSYSFLIKKALEARGVRPMHAVAFRDNKTGEIYQDGPGLTHPGLMENLFGRGAITEEWVDGLDTGEVEKGFVDKQGNFYTQEESENATGFSSESVTQGVNTRLDDILFETSIPNITTEFPKYGDILADFKGTTVRELVAYLVDKGYVNKANAEVVAKLVEHVGDVTVMITEMDPKNPGVTMFDGKNILMGINKAADLWSNDALWNTVAHEMVHAFTRDFMKQNTTESKAFTGKIKGVMNSVLEVMNADPNSKLFQTKFKGSYNELQQYKERHGKLIAKAMKNEFEFLSSVMTDTQAIRWITDRVSVGGPRVKMVGWRRIVRAIQKVMETVGVRRTATAEIFNIAQRSHKMITSFLGSKQDLRFNPNMAKENRRVAKQITGQFEELEYGDSEDLNDLLDPEQVAEEYQDEDENVLENQSIENFTKFMADAWGMPEPAFREYVKGLDDFDSFVKDVNEMNDLHGNVIDRKIEYLQRNYKRNFKDFASFKRAFLKRQYLNVVMKNAYDTFVYMGVREFDEQTGRTEFRYELRQVKGSYRDGKGKKRNTYRLRIALEDYIPELEEKLGLPAGTFKLGFLDGFESWSGGKVQKRTSLDRVDLYMFNQDPREERMPVTGLVADALWNGSVNGATNQGMLYLGSFAGKNTLPILYFDKAKRTDVEKALAKYGTEYHSQALEEFKTDYDEGNTKNPLTPGRANASIARTILEDIWFKAEFQQQEDGTWDLPRGASLVITKDWNKTMKRGTKWNASDTGIILTPEEVEEEFGNAPVNGIEFVPGDALVNAAVISSKNDDLIEFDAGEYKITAKLKELMQNELGTSRIDGASFYIIGHFDKVYRLAHGALKSGALKNLYSSRHGDDPLFIKHAMHGVSAESPLGKFMLQHNLAVLVADESMKEGPQDKIIGANELMDKDAFAEKDPIIKLRLSQFTRIKEEENKDTNGGSTKQFINGSGYSELFNDIIKAASEDVGGDYKISEILNKFTGKMTEDTLQWFKEHTTTEELYNMLKEVVYNPKSPQEQAVSEIWLDFIEPLEGQTHKDVLNKYGGFIQHAHTAEVLRNRMQHRLSEMLGGKTTGMRGALDPNIGWLNYDKDVKPITQNWNLGNILISMEELSGEVSQAAFPETGLREIAHQLANLQRQETKIRNESLPRDDRQIELDDLAMSRQELIGKILEMKSERLADKVNENTRNISPHNLINWSDPKVKKWKEEILFGREYTDPDTKEVKRTNKGIMNIKTGALNEGWAVITEDMADKLGVKAGDWVLLVITPTDSAMGVIGVRVAGIAKSTESKEGGRKVSDNNKVTANSEWLQSLVGKDFDIDTISLVTYDQKFWNKDEFEFLAKVANKVPRKYLSKMVAETKALFKEKGVTPKNADGVPIDVNENTVLQDEVRELYSVLMNGTPRKQMKRRFSMMGASFIELDSAYLHDPAPIINERLFHTATSTINLRAKNVNVPFITHDGRLVTEFKKPGKADKEKISITFNPRHGGWTRTHINHLHMTNAEVDFPNNTTRLAYISNPKNRAYRVQMGKQFWGLAEQEDFKAMAGLDMHRALSLTNLDTLMQTIKGFEKFLFDDSFNLARRRNTDTFEKLDYITTVQQTARAQRKLQALATNNKAELRKLANEYLKGERTKIRRSSYQDTKDYKAKMLVLEQKAKFLESFVENLEVDNVYDFPLFETVRSIKLDSFPIPGTTYKDHLINQVLASKEAVPYYPALQEAYNDAIEHAYTSDSKYYRVGDEVAYKPAYRIMKLLGQSGKDAVKGVRELRKNTELFTKLQKKLRPFEQEDLVDAIKEFDQLDRYAGKPFEPFERDGQLVHVDLESLAMQRMMQSLDFAHTSAYKNEEGKVVSQVRGKLPKGNLMAYWERQLRAYRYEVNSILHAFDEKFITSGEKGVSDTLQQIRYGHAATYPIMWKHLLEQPFLFLNPGIKRIELVHGKDKIAMGHKGGGVLYFSYKEEIFTHKEINDEVSEKAKELKMLLTERNGLWAGIADNSAGTYNRGNLSRILNLARNLTMERRTEILEEHMANTLYGGNRGFTREDQLAFWISIMSQVSDQGMLENKGTGFIVNQTPYDKLRPFKFQTNHVALTLMSRFEPELTNMWMQFYSMAETTRDPHEKEMIAWAIRHGMDSDIEMLYQDVEDTHGNPERTFKHFFSDYVNEHKKLTEDLEFKTFYNKMRTATWDEGLKELRKMVEGVTMLKALSENGVFYEDLVLDLKKLSDAEFYKKYSKVDTKHIKLALDRYMGDGIVDEFIRQRAGENDVEFRTRQNVLVTFYLLNGVKKREGARNKKLTFMRRIGANVIGYDMMAIMGEKQTYALDPKDEPISTVLTVDGPRTITTRDAQNSQRTHATRTDLPIGHGTIALTKGQNVNRSLATHQITMNNQSKRYEDVAKLLSKHGFRNSWRVQFKHKKESKRIPHTQRTSYISELIDQIPESADQQLEVRRQQIWKLAENLKKNFKITLTEDALGNIVYAIKLGAQTVTYDNVRDLIEKHLPKLKASQKLALIGALDIRQLYDVEVPKYIRQVVTYLETTRDDLDSGQFYDQALQIDAMIKKYQAHLSAITFQKGNYMPHQFPIARYKDMWMKGYLEVAVKRIEKDILYHKRKGTGHPLGLLDPKKDKVQIKEMALKHANKVWDQVAAGWNRGSIIPNFIPRKMPDATGYTQTDPTIHYNYIVKLIEGMKKDALRADWLLYQAKARQAGERHHIIELTRAWYANQIGDRSIRTKTRKWTDLRPGEEISFSQTSYILDPSTDIGNMGTTQVSGTIRKIDKDTVWLNRDIDTITFEAKRDLDRLERMATTIMIHGEGERPTQGQWNNLQNFINKGILTLDDFANYKLNEMDQLDALTLLIKGTQRIIKNPDIANTFKRKDIWGSDVTGTAVANTVDVYQANGVVEQMEQKAHYYKNLKLLQGEYATTFTKAAYLGWKGSGVALGGVFKGMKTLAGLFYMGMAAAGKARFVNQAGAFINNVIDAPLYNYFGDKPGFRWLSDIEKSAWTEGMELWSRISHGQLELMDESDAHLYKTLVGLGLTENNNILAIALEAANIKPEDMLVQDSTRDSIKWLAKLFKDATKYDSTYKALAAKEKEYYLESDPTKRLTIKQEIEQIKLKWQAKMHGLLEKSDDGELTAEREKQLWAQLDEMAKKGTPLNLAEEQGFTKAMAAKLFAKVAWKSFFTSNLGMGFQAKAEKLRIPAFFIGYVTAIRMGFTPEEAIQLGVNSVELRHAFYGSANKQYGANTKMGALSFQYAQYQYNAISKAARITREMIPQMMRFGAIRPAEVSRLKHMANMLKLVQVSTDAKGKALKRGEVTLKEINLLHGVLMKVMWTGVMMQVGQRVFYGVTNFQDPVGQVAYDSIDFIIDLFQGGGLDLDDDDDRENAAWMLQELALPLGLLYKTAIQATVVAPEKGVGDTFVRGRVEDTFDFLWRTSNTIDAAAYQLGLSRTKPNKRQEILIDVPWLVDDFTTGIKLLGWNAADNRPTTYTKYGFFGQQQKKAFTQGRYVETGGRGISGTGSGGSNIRALYLFDPLTYIPFLDRLVTGK